MDVPSAVERLGTAGILVIASYYMLKYFIGQLARKDKRLDDITDLFVAATREQTAAIRDFIAEQKLTHQLMAASIDKLTVAVDSLQERRAAGAAGPFAEQLDRQPEILNALLGIRPSRH